MPNQTTQYLIEIIFQAKGAEPTAEKIKKIKSAIEGIDKPAKQTMAQMNDFHRALARVAVVVPMWAAARMAFQAILAPIKEVIKAFTELDAGLAKVMTVTRIAASEQKKFYGELATAAVKYYASSSASMKDITEAMYQIGTAGRSTTEILHGFSSVLNLSIATFGNVIDAGRVLTGILNVYGNSLTDQITATEKMRYISDLLTHTWSNHQVELNEIATAMGYVGAAGETLNIDLKTIVGTIGFLNTGLLRGSKAGTSLLNAFIQIASASDKLRGLGIVFDPRKPLDFVDVMTQLHNQFVESGRSLAMTEDLFDIFGKRGGKAIAVIMEEWEKWRKSISMADSDFQGFAERTKDTAEKTVVKAFQKMFRAMMAGGKELKGTNPLTDFFNNQADLIMKNIEDVKAYQTLIAKGFKFPETTKIIPKIGIGLGGWQEIVPKDLETRIAPIKEFFELIGEAEISENIAKQTEETAINLSSAAERARQLFDVGAQMGLSWRELVKEASSLLPPLLGMTKEEMLQSEHLKNIYEYRKKNLVIAQAEEKVAVGISTALKTKLAQHDLEVKYSLMKTAGAEDEEVAYIKIVDKVKELNDLATKENERRKESGQTLYDMVSLSSVLAGNWGKILNSASVILDKDKDITEFEKLRADIITGLNTKYQKQVNLLRDLTMQYEKADMFEKSRLRRTSELTTMSPKELATAYESSVFDKNLILDYWTSFSEESRKAIEETTVLFKDMLNKIPRESFETMLKPILPEIAPTRAVPLETQAAPTPQQLNVTNVGAQNVEVNVNVPSQDPDEIAGLVGNKVKDSLLTDEEFQSTFAKKLGKKI